MASASSISGKLYTPVDSTTGERKQILVQTTIDNVFDGSTGKSLTKMIQDGELVEQ